MTLGLRKSSANDGRSLDPFHLCALSGRSGNAADFSRTPSNRLSRNETAWAARLALAEAIRARVVTDLKVGAAFPTGHQLHAGSPGIYPMPAASRAIAQGFGPVHDATDLEGIFAASITAVEAGAVAVVDVRVQPGYTAAMAGALTRSPR